MSVTHRDSPRVFFVGPRGCLAHVPTHVIQIRIGFALCVIQTVFDNLNLSSISATQDYALNLSILLSAGKENNSDLLSNGE